MLLTRQKRCEAACARHQTLRDAAAAAADEGKFKLQAVNTNAKGLTKLLQGADVVDKFADASRL
jgi:hypothetical protein